MRVHVRAGQRRMYAGTESFSVWLTAKQKEEEVSLKYQNSCDVFWLCESLIWAECSFLVWPKEIFHMSHGR